ncbi:MAG: DUF3310 domain-containing protein [Bacteroidales bacterium]|nr:DUF3310 domain-containing protein [Bacteroidales bacterium]
MKYCSEGTDTCHNCLIRTECAECEGNFGYLDGEIIDRAYDKIENYYVDNVNHPKHYRREGGMECIEEMILIFGKEPVMTYCLLNAWKYRYRAAEKNGIEDLKKSDWYVAKYKELKEIVDNERDCSCWE